MSASPGVSARSRSALQGALRELGRRVGRVPVVGHQAAREQLRGPRAAELLNEAWALGPADLRRKLAMEEAAGDGAAELAGALAPPARLAVAAAEVGWMQNNDGDHPLRAPVIDAFHRIYYDEARFRGGTWHLLTWRGVRVWKLPFDLWQYQEILHELRPDLIVECGTAFGGSALFLADVCEAIGNGRVLSIDIEPQADLPEHPRIEYVHGSSVDPAVLDRVRGEAAGAGTVMVVLDSDHSRDHVLAECRAYGEIVTPGSYLVVEDTDVNGHPVFPEHGPGPMEAAVTFLAENDDFEHDVQRDKLLFSQNPQGWLRKKRR
ncbi:MAG: CmcI family methyltransferase [Kineosporiaceae bacterium]